MGNDLASIAAGDDIIRQDAGFGNLLSVVPSRTSLPSGSGNAARSRASSGGEPRMTDPNPEPEKNPKKRRPANPNPPFQQPVRQCKRVKRGTSPSQDDASVNAAAASTGLGETSDTEAVDTGEAPRAVKSKTTQKKKSRKSSLRAKK